MKNAQQKLLKVTVVLSVLQLLIASLATWGLYENDLGSVFLWLFCVLGFVVIGAVCIASFSSVYINQRSLIKFWHYILFLTPLVILIASYVFLSDI